MKKLLTSASFLVLIITSATAEARCSTDDLKGRWDVYGLTDTINVIEQEDEDGVEDGIVTEVEVFNNATTLDCVINTSRRGVLRRSNSFCLERDQVGDRLKWPLRGEIDIRRNCTIGWTLDIIDRQLCRLDGTMTQNKEIVSGVATCDGGSVALFTMVRR